VVAGEERHAVGRPAARVEQLGQDRELGREAVFGQITRQNQVIRAAALRGRERRGGALAPRFRRVRAAEGDVRQPALCLASPRFVTFLEQMEIAQMRYLGHGMDHGSGE
jgi:hypothetical protein